MITPPPVIGPDAVALTSVQKRGRAILAAALGLWLIIALCIDVLVLAVGNISTFPVVCVRLVLTVALFYAVWIGQNWARWLTVSIFAVAFFLSVRHFVLNQNPFLLIHTLLFLAILLMFVFVLVLSKHVAAFLSYQRARR